MNSETIAKVCALLFLYGDSITITKLNELISSDKSVEQFSIENINAINHGLRLYGLQIVNSGDQIQMTTTESTANITKAIKMDEVSGDLTPAALQVMTIVTYLPGSNKSDISYIRGAQSSTSIRSLLTRGLVFKKDDKFYPTTEALQYLGVSNIEELPEYAKLSNDFKEKLNESLQDEN